MPSSGIFISYRREDAAGHAGWLRDGLTAHFGEDQVFMDLGLEPGVDFVEQIEAGISGCAALLVVIGQEWLTTTGADGRRRLDDEGDFVRLEVATALARPGLRVVPILVHDARMPVAKELPEDLEPLARRQAIELSNERWKFDVGRLIGTLERVLAAHAASIGQQPDRSEESATDQSPVQPDQPASDESAPEGTLPAGTAGEEAPPEEMSPEGTLAALTVAEEAPRNPSEEDAPRGHGPGADPPEHTPPDEELADDTPTHLAAPPWALHPRGGRRSPPVRSPCSSSRSSSSWS